jgi:siroheme synthase-like protein
MSYLPIALNLNQQSILIVGGGKVALQKLKSIQKCLALSSDSKCCEEGAHGKISTTITIVAPHILEDIEQQSQAVPYIQCIPKAYSKEDLQGHTVVYICTNNSDLNQEIVQHAKAQGCLTQVADNPSTGDFMSSALFASQNPDHPWSVAVSTGGKDVKKAVQWRNRIGDFLMGHKDWCSEVES